MQNLSTKGLLKQIKDLQEELQKLKKQKKYGIVWEEKPENIDKNKFPIIEEFKELRIEESEEKPYNLIIEGDNFHSLSVLQNTHKNKIDVIYIDPPYNTGKKDFTYNDNYVDEEDNYKHSKWLSFMNKRLKLAKDLLTDYGVIFISIDDNEFAQLKLLCDEIFGGKNFISCLSVENNPKGRKNSNFISISNDYCLIYTKNKLNEKNYFIENIPKDIKEIKIDNLGKKYSHGKRVLVGESTNNIVNDFNNKKHYSIYYNSKKNDIIIKLETDIKLSDFNLESKGYKRYISSKNNIFIENTYTKEEFLKLFFKNSIIFKENSIYEKDFNLFTRMKSLLVNNISKGLDFKTETAGKILKNIGIEFTNPKNPSFIKILLKLKNNPNSIILDFFAGSGTTGHAVLELNKEDGGNRQFILCSNSEKTAKDPEKNICRNITYERNKRIIKGYTNAKGEKIEGLGGNLRYYKNVFIEREKSIDDLRFSFINKCNDLLCIKENTFTKVNFGKDIPELKIFKNKNHFMVILYDVFYLEETKKILEEFSNKNISLYAFSMNKSIFFEEFINYKNIIIENIPDEIMETYEKIFNS